MAHQQLQWNDEIKQKPKRIEFLKEIFIFFDMIRILFYFFSPLVFATSFHFAI